jgi:ubiquinone/menaquinone biosynthesis C-methylase UbiE
MESEEVKKFWDGQAKQFEQCDLATAPDHHYRTLEIDHILSHLENKGTVLDVGCGNGYSTLRFAKVLPFAKFIGVDYSELMIEHARAAQAQSGLTNVEFHVGNVLSLADLPVLQGGEGAKFDCIVSERCLINLSSWDEQQHALLQMKAVLSLTGTIILTENTQEGMTRLNELRASIALPPIAVRWHNFYLPQTKLEKFLQQHFLVEAVKNIGNLYYIISRVVYAKLAALEGKEPSYDHPINEIAARLPSLSDYQYSPNFIYVLRNAPR